MSKQAKRKPVRNRKPTPKQLVKPVNECRAFNVVVVQPTGAFHPRAVHQRPREFAIARPLTWGADREWAERTREKYNRRAMSRGWKTWAIIGTDRELATGRQA